jgi:hypothetical protein
MMGFARKIPFEDAIFLTLPILRGARLTQRLCDPALWVSRLRDNVLTLLIHHTNPSLASFPKKRALSAA